MHWWQWAIYALSLIVVFSLFDSCFRISLRGDVTVTQLEGAPNRDTLIVSLPGLVADGDWSVRKLTDTWRNYGDVWLVGTTGDRFDYQQLATEVASMLEEDTHDHVVFVGSSLGAFSALDVMERLSREERGRTTYELIAVCAPSQGVQSIKQPLKLLSGVAAVLRFGPGTNATWGKLYTRSITGKQPRSFAMTYYIDQVNYVRMRPAPETDIRVLYVQAERDEIVSASAARAWVTDTADVVLVDSKHVAYDTDPERWNEAFREAFDQLEL